HFTLKRNGREIVRVRREAAQAVGPGVAVPPAKNTGKPAKIPVPEKAGEPVGEVRSFAGHTNAGNAVAFSPDGPPAASGDHHGQVLVWDMVNRRQLYSFEAPWGSGHINGLAFSPDGGMLLLCGLDPSPRLWDVKDRKTLRAFWGHTDQVTGAAFSADG